ncbi:unnamed protein product [Leuciscus chuanchicus]
MAERAERGSVFPEGREDRKEIWHRLWVRGQQGNGQDIIRLPFGSAVDLSLQETAEVQWCPGEVIGSDINLRGPDLNPRRVGPENDPDFNQGRTVLYWIQELLTVALFQERGSGSTSPLFRKSGHSEEDYVDRPPQ